MFLWKSCVRDSSMGLSMVALAIALAPGCGGSDASSSGAGGTTTVADPCEVDRMGADCLADLDAACAEQWKALCDARFACEPIRYRIVYGTADACTTRNIERCKNYVRLPDTAATPSALRACAQAYTDPLCSGTITDECNLPGAREPGDPCAANGQCASGACGAGPEGSECGVCVARRSEGQSCDPANDDCGLGLACLATTSKCAPQLAEGSTCASHYDCEKDLICVDQKCAQPLGEGAPCAEQICDLEQSLSCSNDVCTKFKIVGVGESCLVDLCVAGSACDGQNMCVVQPIEGQPCGDFGCSAPAGCHGGLCTFEYATCP